MVEREEKYCTTSLEEIPEIIEKLRQYYNKNAPFSYEFRLKQLKQLERLVIENEKQIIDACGKYFKDDPQSATSYRLYPVRYDLGLMITNLHKYMKPKYASQPFPINLMWEASIEHCGRGVVGIIAPWNFPVQLLLRPLIGAIAAGNCVVLKPSEITDEVARLMADLIPKYLDSNVVRVICGGPKETNAMIHAKLDLCLFTGSTMVGKIIMKACAEHLTPVILELGGKNPVFVDDQCDLEIVAKRLLYGRFLNCGQLCLSPEYIFISRNNSAKLIASFRKVLKEFYGENLSQTNRFPRIVNEPHFKRLKEIRDYYLSERQSGGKIVIGGSDDNEFYFEDKKQERFMPPMILSDVDFYKDKIMDDEVFGPFLSIIPMEGNADGWLKETINMVQSKPKPLACYVFSTRSAFVNKIKDKISAGAIVINDTVFHMTLQDLPFGGIGESGCGHYGGYQSFLSFSHEKPIAKRTFGLEGVYKDRYPNGHVENLKPRMERLIPRPKSTIRTIAEVGLAMGLAGVGAHVALKKYAKIDIVEKVTGMFSS